MRVVARLRYLGVPPLKVRRFATTIKGEPVERAMAILELQSSPTCQSLCALLKSAVHNALNNHELAAENLLVSNVMVDAGPTLKRIKPRARGRAFRILKRSSHVTIELDLMPGITIDEAGRELKPRGRRSAKPAASPEGKPKKAKKLREAVAGKARAKDTKASMPKGKASARISRRVQEKE
ncbi:50S ribosomal protein L22 [bacterium]|nr:50S ribosomal protein L22 [bacterium]